MAHATDGVDRAVGTRRARGRRWHRPGAALTLAAVMLCAHGQEGNLPPTASIDTNRFETPEDQTLNGVLTVTDPEGEPVTCEAGTLPPPRGTVTFSVTTPCEFTYAPRPNANGRDLFSFLLRDGSGDPPAEAYAEVFVTPENDPVQAEDQAFTVKRDTPGVGALAALDPDGDRLAFALIDLPRLGTVELLAGKQPGIFRYTPAPGVSGTDRFTFTVAEADVPGSVPFGPVTVTVTITPTANRPPSAPGSVFATPEDEPLRGRLPGVDADGDALTFELVLDPARTARKGLVRIENERSGDFTYSPDPDETGVDVFFYRIGDGTVLTAPIRVEIAILPVNDAPRISGTPPPRAESGVPVSFVPQIGDPDDTDLQIVVEGCPSWAKPSCDQGTGEITGTPATDGSDAGPGPSITIRASDGRKSASLGPFQIPVTGLVPVTRASPFGGAFNRPVDVALTCVLPDTVQACGTFFSTDPGADVGDFTPYAGPVRIDSSTTLRFFSETASGTELPQAVAFLIDTTPPVLTISEPDQARLQTFPDLAGTATDDQTPLASVSVQLTNGSVYLADTASGLQVTPVPSTVTVPVAGDGGWALLLPPRDWPPGEWSVDVRARDAAGNEARGVARFDYIDPTRTAFTRIALASSSPTVLSGAALSIGGRLERLPANQRSLAALPLQVTVRDTAGTPVLDQLLRTTDALGNYSLTLDGLLTATGRHTIEVSFAGSERLEPSTASIGVLVGASAGYAIVVQGRIASEEGFASHAITTSRVYEVLRARGFEDDNIQYFSYDAAANGLDGTPTTAAIRDAIVTWASARLNSAPAPLFVVYVGHANPGELFVDDADTITPTVLDGWLDDLEATVTPVNLEAAPRVLVLGGCYTESFVRPLSAAGRVVIAAAGRNERSYRGPLEGFEPVTAAPIRTGELFVELLFKRLAEDLPLPRAYEEARDVIEIFSRRGGVPNASIYFDNATQHPFFDDDGDGAGSHRLARESGDGVASQALFLGVNATSVPGAAATSGAPVGFSQITPTLRLGAGRDIASIEAVPTSPALSGPAWIEIREPAQVLDGRGGTVTFQQDNALAQRLLIAEDGVFRFRCGISEVSGTGDACFPVPGRYEIYYFIKDSSTGAEVVSALQRSIVYVGRPGNRPPDGFSLQHPQNQATVPPAIVLDWTDARDPDGDRAVTYELELAADPDFANVLLRRTELSGSALAVDPAVGLAPGQTYTWRVRAVDSFGAVRDADSVSTFTVADTGARGLVRGVVFNEAAALPVAGAQITVGTEVYTSDTSGSFLIALPPDPTPLHIEAAGFDPADVPAVDVQANTERTLTIPLLASALSVLGNALTTAEDTDLSGTVEGFGGSPAAAFVVDGGPQHGTLVGGLNPTSGAFVYRPAPDFVGTDAFTFRLREGSASSASARLRITVTPTNDAPEVVASATAPALPRVVLGSNEPTGVSIATLLAGRATDRDGDAPLGIAVTDRQNALGNWEYSLDNGVQWFALPLVSPASGFLLGLDSITRIRFQPEAPGRATLQFRVWDGSAGNPTERNVDTRRAGGTSAFSSALLEAAVSVDAAGNVPVALPVNFDTGAGAFTFSALKGTGNAGDPGRVFRLVTRPRRGIVRLLNPLTGQIRYRAFPGQSGSDSFAFRLLSNGRRSNVALVRINVIPTNQPPRVTEEAFSTRFDRALEIRPRARDPEGAPLSYDTSQTTLGCGALSAPPAGFLESPPVLIYTPTSGAACGPDLVRLAVNDGSHVVNAALPVTVTDVPNPPPTATAASFATDEDQAFRGALAGTDPDGEPLTFRIVSGASRGEVALLHPVTGRFSYTPHTNLTGADSFSFVASDGESDSAPALVSIQINPVEDPPSIGGTAASTVSVGNSYAFRPDASDPDAGDTLSFTFQNRPEPWASFDPATGGISGTPQVSDVGVYRNVTIRVSDGKQTVALPGFDIAVLERMEAPQIVRSTADGAYADPQFVELTCFDPAGGSCEIFYTLDEPAEAPVFEDSSALRAGPDLQIRGEVVGASSGVARSASFALTQVLGQAGVVGSSASARYRLNAGAVSADSDGDGTPDFYDLFPTDPSAFLTYGGPIAVDETATLRFGTRDEQGNVGTVTASTYTIDNQAPTIRILAPDQSTGTQRILFVSGTVADPGGTGVQALSVEIRDRAAGQFLVPGGVSATPVQLPAAIDDAGEWLLFTGTVPFALDTLYEITARARDAAGNEAVVTRLVQLSDNPEAAFTRLSLAVSPRRVLVDGTFTLAGKLTRLPDAGISLAGQPIRITVREPDGDVLFERATTTVDELGNFRVAGLTGFLRTGSHQVQVNFDATPLLADSEARTPIQVASGAGIAILVQGKRDAAAPDPGHTLALDRIRDALLQRGLSDLDIQYLGYGASPGIDGEPTRTNIEDALTVWAPAALADAPAPLLLILVGYGNNESFPIGADALVPQDLALALDDLELGLSPDALANPRLVLIAANAAGSFLPTLSAPGRIVVTSTSAEGSAYQGPLEPGPARAAARFMGELFTRWVEDRSLAESFDGAAAAVRTASRIGGAGDQAQSPLQRPLLDDGGDGAGSEQLGSGGPDGVLARQTFLGVGRPLVRLGVREVSETLTLDDDTSSALLWAKLTDGVPLDAPWVTVRGPLDVAQPAASDLQALLPGQRVALTTFNAVTDRWEATHAGFTAPGRYALSYHVVDAVDGSASPAVLGTLYKNVPENTAPGAPSLDEPTDGARIGTAGRFAWIPAPEPVDPDGDAFTYTFEIALDPSFAEPVVRLEGIETTSAEIGPDAGLRDLTTYHWRVLAVDEWGAVGASASNAFLTDNSNARDGFLDVTVTDPVGTPLENVEIFIFESNGGVAGPLEDEGRTAVDGRRGFFIASGEKVVTVALDGFVGQTFSPVQVEDGYTLTPLPVVLAEDVQVDLRVELAYTPTWTRVGAATDYQIMVFNDGEQTATDVIVASRFVGVPFTVEPPAECTTDADGLTCPIPDLAPGAEPVMLMVRATPDAPSGVAQLLVSASATEEPDLNGTNNTGVVLNLTVLDTDNDGVPDDRDDNPLPNAVVELQPGLNLIALPVLPATVQNARDLLDVLSQNAVGAGALRVERLSGGQWQRYQAGDAGVGFALVPGEGYVISADEPLNVDLEGDRAPRTQNLVQGVNLIGFPTETTADAFGLLRQLAGKVSAIVEYDRTTDRYRAASLDAAGPPVGSNFPFVRGRAYFVTVRTAVPAFELQ